MIVLRSKHIDHNKANFHRDYTWNDYKKEVPNNSQAKAVSMSFASILIQCFGGIKFRPFVSPTSWF